MRLLRQLWDSLFGEDDIRQIRSNLWILVSTMNNPTMTVFKDGYTFTVTDPGVSLLWPRRARALRRLMQEQGVTIVDAVIPTHAHPDHIGALGSLLQEFGPTHCVYVHEADEWMVEQPQTLAVRMEQLMAEAGDHFRSWYLRPLYPLYGLIAWICYGRGGAVSVSQYRSSPGVWFRRLTEDAAIRLGFDGYTLRVFHNPGHCPGELAMEVEGLDDDSRTIVVCGDLVINDHRGRNHLTSGYLPDAMLSASLRSLRRLEALEPEVLIVTHSEPIFGKKEIRSQLRLIRLFLSTLRRTATLLCRFHPEWSLDRLAKETFRTVGVDRIATFGLYEQKSWVRDIYLDARSRS